MLINLFRFYRSSPRFLIIALLVTCVNLWYFRAGIRSAWAIVNLPFVWNRHASEFLISKEHDDFDLSFANYSLSMDSSMPTYPDLVPPVMHHITLGSTQMHENWIEARQACLEYHEGWEAHLWTDENASDFVQEYFPQFKHTWDRYKYPIQRIDALRYMVLYEYGGVVLDMDLKCTRSLGPLRRFGFVAPSAHPTGFSIGFMMASKRNAFVGELVRNLKIYNHHWFALPYPTVMFSTGCHYASSIHTLQPNRTELKILAGPSDNPRLHSLNGDVVTPLFHHLGSSSWHSYDASLIVSIGKGSKWLRLVFIGFLVGVFAVATLSMRARKRSHETRDPLGKKIPLVDFDGRIA